VRLRRLPAAEADIDEIWFRIALRDEAAAYRMIDRLSDAHNRLAAFPEIGQARPDVRSDLRHWPVRPYLILYRADPNEVTIVRVVHGARNLRALFLG
jgi:toxin ParE1/3/4